MNRLCIDPPSCLTVRNYHLTVIFVAEQHFWVGSVKVRPVSRGQHGPRLTQTVPGPRPASDDHPQVGVARGGCGAMEVLRAVAALGLSPGVVGRGVREAGSLQLEPGKIYMVCVRKLGT